MSKLSKASNKSKVKYKEITIIFVQHCAKTNLVNIFIGKF
jgi:hypothetical protein